MKLLLKRLIFRLVGVVIILSRATCRFRIHGDPRDELTAQGRPHVFAALHAHQLPALMLAAKGSRIMVSRSQDGDIIVPTLKMLGHVPCRGSAGSRKGGATALQTMVKAVREGHCGILTVDGPRGPRGKVQRGISMLAQKSGATVIVVSVISRQRWILSRSWDRLQIPKPFARVDVYFELRSIEEGEDFDTFAKRVEDTLAELEWRHDPEEAKVTRPEPPADIVESRVAA